MNEFFRKPLVKILMLKGQEGQSIKSIEKTSTSGLVDTYTITLTDGTTSTFSVTNGKEISSISKTGTSGLVDTYTITFNDGTTSTFTVKNGENGDKAEIEKINKALETNTSNIAKNTTSITNLNNATKINLLKPTLQTTTLNGVTCTNNGDGTYTLNGTATAQTRFVILGDIPHYLKGKRLVGCPSGGANSTYNILVSNYESKTWISENREIGNGINIGDYSKVDIEIFIASGVTCNNLVFKPMITTNLNATYDDFVSYEDSLATNKLMSTRVNLLIPPLQTQTLNGVTCTNNGDGTYTLNGTASSGTLFEAGKIKFNKTTTIKIVGCPKDGSTTKYDATLQKDGGDWQTFMDLGNGAVATIDDTSYYYRYCIEIRAGYTCNNLVFKPMITPNLNATYDDFISCLGTTWTQDTSNGYYTKTIICSGITSADNPTVDVVLSGTLEEMQSQQENWGKILKVETSTDTLKFYASEPTTVSLSVMVKGV